MLSAAHGDFVAAADAVAAPPVRGHLTALASLDAATQQSSVRQETGETLLKPVFTGWNKAVNWLGIAAWAAALVYFWAWWIDPSHVQTTGRYAVVTAVLAWITLIPAYFILIFAFARVPTGREPRGPQPTVAAVVTKAPQEPFAVVQKTLAGALAQAGVEHDTWLADENPDAETLEWCRTHGVKVSTRKGIADYQRPDWPRRARSKEGNLAYFYDHYGYRLYDVVAQFDADHVPSPDYLKHVVAPFEDPAVGYVSAPSICDANAAGSWAARGRLYIEASMHGALQCGYNAGWAPLCIGSHYAVRTRALEDVGGLGPELAEDHSTTLILNAGGWRGVHAVDAIAHGDGPNTFADLVIQEFQWSRSLVTILLEYSPIYVPKLQGRIRFQFLFSQLWYPMFSTFMAVMFLMPVWALVSGEQLVNVTYIAFIAHILPLSLVLLVLAYWWRSTGYFRPSDAKIFGWENIAFLFLRWPWALFGSMAAVVDRLRGQVAGFRVTPKGGRTTDPLPFRILAPYLVFALGSAAAAFFVRDAGTAAGFYIFTLLNAAIYAGFLAMVLVRHARENGLPLIPRDKGSLAAVASILVTVALGGGAIYENGPKGLAAMNEGITAFTLTRTQYPFSGAGQGEMKPVIRFAPRWKPREEPK